MIPKRFLRGVGVVALVVLVLGAIGLMLTPVQARPMGVFDWPGTVAPCNNAASLQTCIDNLASGDVIHLLPGTYTQSVTLGKAVSLIGDGSNVVIFSAPPGQRILTIDGPIGAGTVISGFALQDANLSGAVCPGACGGGMLITGTARPTLQNLYFHNNHAAQQGGGLWVAAGLEVQLGNVVFYSNTSDSAGGGLYAEAPVALVAGYFNQNSSLDSGGGVYVTGTASYLKDTSSSFYYNSAIFGGGAWVNGSAVLTGSTFSSNNGNLGGGLYANTLTATNAGFSINSAASSNGGGVWVNGGAQLTNGYFSSNTAYGSGGGLYANTLNARGTEFYNNIAYFGVGGGAYIVSGTNVIEQAVFQGNRGGYGGGLFSGAGTRLTYVTMTTNSATSSYGGGAYVNGALNVLGGIYQNNSAVLDGGGIYLFGPLQLSNGRFEGNISQSNGGALYVDGNVGVTNTRFINNSANAGGGLWHNSGDGRVVNSLFLRNHNVYTGAAELSLNSFGQFAVLHSTFADTQGSLSAAIGAGNATVNVTDTIMTQHLYGITAGSGAVSEDYNLYFGNLSNWSGPVVTGVHSLNTNPLFVDPATDDYHLQTHSPAVDTGVNAGVNFDIDGQPRPILAGYDIGFDEMGSLIQLAIDNAAPGGAVHVTPGVYTESLRLWKPVSLIGDNAQTTIVNALPDQRVLAVTDESITATTVISGLAFRRGALGGSLCPDACGGGIFISGTARPQLQNIALRENNAYQGGGLWAGPGPDLDLVNVVFANNASYYNGGGLYVDSNIGLVGGRFERNSATYGIGGGAYTSGGATTDGVTFANNQAQGDGGGLAAEQLTMTATDFLNNASGQGGGGARILYGPTQLAGGKFAGNQALGSSGGGLFAYGPLQITGTSFISNTAPCTGDCSAAGGGAYAGGAAILTNASFFSNTAQNGGGLYASQGVTLTKVAFVGNRADYGGGLKLTSGFEVRESRFVNNQAQYAGDGLYSYFAGPGRVINSLFTRNQGDGAALYLYFSSPVDVIYTTIANSPRVTTTAINADNSSLTVLNTIIAGQQVGITSTGAVTQSNNLYFNNQVDAAGSVTTTGPIITGLDPRFVNPLIDDYHLRLGSPAVNRGVDAGIYTDIDGQTRPIGAGYEIGFDELIGTIQEAIDATPPGGTVTIPSGVYTESLTLGKPVSLIGAGSGATIINAVAGSRVLTVTGSPITLTTQIASLTLRGGFDQMGGGVLITGTASPTFNGVSIAGNSAAMGGGLYVYNGGVRLVTSDLTGNTATQSGGGAYVASSAATLEQLGGSIVNNHAIDGGGVFVQNGLFQQNGGAILGNVADNWGGGLIIGGGGQIKTRAGYIINNTAGNAGGGLFVGTGYADLANTAVVSNTSYEGAGLYVRALAGAGGSLVGGRVQGNRATGYGGGVYAGSSFNITGTVFYLNSAYDGSAVEITGTADARLVNAFVGENAAGGAFPSTNASVRFDSSGQSQVLHTSFGNYTVPLTRALVVNNGVVTVSNTIVASYTQGLSQFGGRLTEDYNLFFQTPVTFTGSISHGGHSLLGIDPLFKNPVGGDYHLKGFSPAVNAGANVGVLRDIDLDARPLAGAFDIGADEASVASTTANPSVQSSFTYTTPQSSIISLIVPPGAVTETIPLYCSLVASNTTPLPGHLGLAGFMFELDAQLNPLSNTLPGTITFLKPVTLTVSYTDQQLADAGITNESTLRLYRYETSLNEWKPIGYRPGESQSLDMQHNVITAVILGFSKWGQLGAQSNTTLFLPLVLKN